MLSQQKARYSLLFRGEVYPKPGLLPFFPGKLPTSPAFLWQVLRDLILSRKSIYAGLPVDSFADRPEMEIEAKG